MQPTDPKLYEKIKQQVRSRVERWPSAYASGMLVKEYERQMKLKNREPFMTPKPSTPNLTRWFKEEWVDIKTNKSCGSVKSPTYYPTCRPSIKITDKTPVTINQLSKQDKKSMIGQKQKAKEKTVTYKETRKNRQGN